MVNKQDYYDIGNDTERWWKEHIKGIAPHLKHTPSAKGWDFHGTMDDMEVYVDVKFCRTRYRKPGWVEAKSWGKTTGIVKTAIENRHNGGVEVYIVVLHCGWWHLLDVKAILEAHAKGNLPLQKQDTWADNGEKCEAAAHWQLNGWNDGRFLIAEGPLNPKHWNPRTTIGKSINIDAWMEGEWTTK